MRERAALDVSHLPDIDRGSGSLFWWGNVGLIGIESMTFAIGIATYLYLRTIANMWPPATVDPPALLGGTIGLLLLLASVVPMRLADKSMEVGKENVGRIKAGLVGNLVLSAIWVVVRVLEFRGLHTKWNESAYGSVTWLILGLHGGETFASILDTGVLTAMVFRGHIRDKTFLDIRADSLFWYFLVAIWVPLYAVVYIVPRVR